MDDSTNQFSDTPLANAVSQLTSILTLLDSIGEGIAAIHVQQAIDALSSKVAPASLSKRLSIDD